MPRIDNTSYQSLRALTHQQKLDLYTQATALISDNKRDLFERLAPLRTRHIAVVLEDIYQSHNASAVLRSCDCFGVQDVHVIEAHNPFNPAGDVAVGSSKWIDYYPYPNTAEAYQRLRDMGYRIVATTPHTNDTIITDLDLSQPIALVFGTELTGLSQEAIDMADSYVKIPMYGFTESFNISVCAALSLFSLTSRLRGDCPPVALKEGVYPEGGKAFWQLSEEEILDLKIHWCTQTIRDGQNVVNALIDKL